MNSFEIRCSNCNEPTGAWHHGGDPYLPFILCGECHERDEKDPDEVDPDELADANFALRSLRADPEVQRAARAVVTGVDEILKMIDEENQS